MPDRYVLLLLIGALTVKVMLVSMFDFSVCCVSVNQIELCVRFYLVQERTSPDIQIR